MFSILQTHEQAQASSPFFLSLPLHTCLNSRQPILLLGAGVKAGKMVCEVPVYISSDRGNHYHPSSCHRPLYHLLRPLGFNSFTHIQQPFTCRNPQLRARHSCVSWNVHYQPCPSVPNGHLEFHLRAPGHGQGKQKLQEHLSIKPR